MHQTLLTTKLYFPTARSSLVSRPRLVDRLQAGLCGPLTLISAPAGSGKTTLLSEWRAGAGAGLPVSWISLDAADNDPLRFFQYMSAALDTLQPGVAQEIQPLLQSFEQPNIEALLTMLVNTLDGFLQDFVLVFDDYHVIDAPTIHEALTFLLDHLPPHMHLVFLTRADPPLPIARFRARGQLTEIRATDLRFSVDEATRFLNQVMGLNLTGEQVAALEARSEGWITGLQLAALSMQGRKDVTGFISTFTGSHQYIVDYLAEEVLNRQPETIREFLLKTSLLDRLTGTLCDAVIERTGGQAMLEMLAHSNLFLIPLDDERCWFRYHHLFADLLQNRLRQSSRPQAIADLHQRASKWYDSHKMLNDAIEHSLAAQEYEEVKRLLRGYFPGWFRAENRARTFQWLEGFPKDFLEAEPWLCVVYAWIVWSWGKMGEAETYLAYAQQALIRLEAAGKLPVGDFEYDGLPAEILAFRALISAQRDDPDYVIELANQALALSPENAHTVRGIAHLALQTVYRNLGEMEKAIEACRLGLPEAQAGAEIGTVVSILQTLGVTLFIQGRLHEAAQVYREGLEHAASKGEAHFPAYSLIRMRLADIHYQWNQLDDAENLVKTGLERSDFGGNLWGMFYGRHLFCRILFARGDRQGVQKILSEIEGILPKMVGAYYSEELNCVTELTKVRLGVIENAELGNLTAPSALGDNPTTTQVERVLNQMNVQVALKKTEQIPEMLSELERITSRRGNLAYLIKVFILQAVVWQRKGELERALTGLEKALSLAKPEGFMRVFLDEGEPIRELLKVAGSRLKDETVVRYSRELLEAFVTESAQSILAKQQLIEPLSERELEVLQLVAVGKSNQQIANALFITRGTVKKHLNNIFGKLNVQSRTQCVARGRELNLL